MIYWLAISAVLLAGYVALMLFYFVGWRRTKTFLVQENFSPKTKVSVIVAARNEELNIENCIHSVLNQDYPKDLIEVIVIDDHSEDKTFEIVESFKEPRLYTLRLAEVVPNGNQLASFKKKAIQYGIKNSTGELIITTDADCIAKSKWLSTVVAYYEKCRPRIIAAPVAFSNEDSWIEKWQSLDLCGMIAITGGAITNRFPNMCNGANLAYEKKTFEEVGGFAGIDTQPSGDDVMLMMKIDRKYPGSVHFLKSRDAIVSTKPVETLQELFQQRVRWLSKGTAFPDWRVSLTLVFAWFFNLSILVNLVAGFFIKELWLVAGVLFLVKTLLELPLLWSGCSFFEKVKLMLLLIPAQAAHILYVVLVGGVGRFYKYEWKGRRY